MEQTDKVQPIEVQSPDEKLIARVMAIINKEIANPNLSVEMIAAEAGISRVHLYRKIKEFTNQSPRNFIRNVRLKQAALLLAQKHHNITEVAEAVGLPTPLIFRQRSKNYSVSRPLSIWNRVPTTQSPISWIPWRKIKWNEIKQAVGFISISTIV